MIQDTAWSPRFVPSTTATAATSGEAIAGTDTTKFITPSLLPAATSYHAGPVVNGRAPRQGLVFDGTAGATVSGVPAFGTSDFTISAWVNQSAAKTVAITDATSESALFRIINDGSVRWYVDGVLKLNIAGAMEYGKNLLLTLLRTGGTVYIYKNGILIGSALDSASCTNGINRIGQSIAGSEYWNGFLSVLIYNRALSASEVVSLYEAGAPAGADYNSASNTSIITGANSDFSSDTGYWAKGNGATISGGKCNLTGGVNSNISRAGLCTNGKKWRVTFTISTGDATGLYISDGGITALIIGITGTGTKTYEFTGGPSGGFQIVSPNGTAVIDDLTLYPIGLLLAPDAAQAGGGLVWYDTSGNAANISWTSGVSWNVPTSGYVTSGSSLNLSAGGTNQNITLTPSGTGGTVIQSNANNGDVLLKLRGTSASPNGTIRWTTNTDTYTVGIGSRFNIADNGLEFLIGSTTTGAALRSNGNFLIGTTTDGGQKLQVNGVIAAGTTGGDRITLSAVSATDQYFLAQNYWNDNGTDNVNTLARGSWRAVMRNATSNTFNIDWRAANAAAGTFTNLLSLDSSGNATFAGVVVVGGGNASSAALAVNYSSAVREPIAIVNSAVGGKYWYIGDGTGTSNGIFAIRSGSDAKTVFAITGAGNASTAGTISPQQAATVSAPTYVKGAIYFDTTLNKLRVGGATDWETITSA